MREIRVKKGVCDVLPKVMIVRCKEMQTENIA